MNTPRVAVIPNVFDVPAHHKRTRRLRDMLGHVDLIICQREQRFGFDTEEGDIGLLRSKRRTLLWVLDLIDPVIRECPRCHAGSEAEAGTACTPQEDGCPMAGPGTWEENLQAINRDLRGGGAPMLDAEDWMLQERKERAARWARKKERKELEQDPAAVAERARNVGAC